MPHFTVLIFLPLFLIPADNEVGGGDLQARPAPLLPSSLLLVSLQPHSRPSPPLQPSLLAANNGAGKLRDGCDGWVEPRLSAESEGL